VRILVVVAALLPAVAYADPPPESPPPPTPLDRGHFGFGGGASEETLFGDTYFAIGANASYYVLDGVSVGLGATYQFANGGGPSVEIVTPAVRYAAKPLLAYSPIVPYVGAFYSHYFIGDAYADEDAIGASAGGLYVSGRSVLGLGVAVEHLVSSCTTDCTQVYPDLTIGIAF
jgi:hypothetical protein